MGRGKAKQRAGKIHRFASGGKEKALRDERSACRFSAAECDYWTDSVTVVLLVTGLAPPVVALMVTV
jgi:hypothetical protein